MTTNATERVAIVTVHGVADQQPGQTVRELARLLCHGADGPPAYGEGETHGVFIPVTPLPPRTTHASPQASAAKPDKRAPVRLPRPGAPSDFYCSESQPTGGGNAPRGQAARTDDDLGITLTDYLLSRYQPAERDALYESLRIALKRRSDGRAVDLYELYWADYSRLQPGGARALSATYQLLFHLSTLARDVVDQIALAGHAAGAPRAWSLMQLLHAWSAWLLRAPAALLQMAMVLLFVFGMAALVPDVQQQLVLAAVAGGAAALLGGIALLGWLRPPAVSPRSKALAFGVAAVASAGVAIAALVVPRGFPWLYFGTAVVLTGALGMALVWRFGKVARDVKTIGLLVMAALVVLLFARGQLNLPHATTQAQWMLDSALNTGEYLLAALLLAWSLQVAVQVVALGLGFVLARGVPAAVRESIVTARLGMILSTALFALLSLLLWSVLSYLAGFALDGLYYLPVFGSGGAYPGANVFLENQVKDVGTLFTPLVLFGAVLGGIAVLALAPALREELVPTANLVGGRPSPTAQQWSIRLGAWLGRARRLLKSLFSWVVPLLAIAGGFLFFAFFLQRLFGVPSMLSWLDPERGETLVAAGKWLAGGAVTVTALGARFTQTFGKLRVALDAILDVDNYFRDPLDRRPPRARIFSRFTSLLAHLRERGYTRIVVVSHSQGTVISADLLRYLQHVGRLPALLGEASVSLVTLGSPLRDLYAQRFPLLYAWIGPAEAFASATPTIDELGVVHWVNAYRCGDYVGRALWTPHDDAQVFAVAATSADGEVAARRAAGRTEFCLGAGAHTHYFSNDAVALAATIDHLVGAPTLEAQPRSGAAVAPLR
jgi:hypothetical protein